jgi:hypothetical protein
MYNGNKKMQKLQFCTKSTTEFYYAGARHFRSEEHQVAAADGGCDDHKAGSRGSRRYVPAAHDGREAGHAGDAVPAARRRRHGPPVQQPAR